MNEETAKKVFRGVTLFIATMSVVVVVSALLNAYISHSLKVENSQQALQTVEAHKEPFMRVVEENVSSMTSMSPMNVHYRILVDKETGVMYYAEYADGYRAGGAAITPLYNADGTLRIYKGE